MPGRPILFTAGQNDIAAGVQGLAAQAQGRCVLIVLKAICFTERSRSLTGALKSVGGLAPVDVPAVVSDNAHFRVAVERTRREPHGAKDRFCFARLSAMGGLHGL